MDNPESQNIVVVARTRVRPLSPVKAADIGRVAQRILDEEGRIRVSQVYQKCRPRIPGAIYRYGATLERLINKQLLKKRDRVR